MTYEPSDPERKMKPLSPQLSQIMYLNKTFSILAGKTKLRRTNNFNLIYILLNPRSHVRYASRIKNFNKNVPPPIPKKN